MGIVDWMSLSRSQQRIVISVITLGITVGFVGQAVAQETNRSSANATDRSLTPSVQPVALTYQLGAGDQIGIEVYQAPRYSGEFVILVNGTVTLPVVGNISLAGMTIEQARERIVEQYSRIIRRPSVTIRLLNPRPVQVGVAGEVGRPGSYTVDRDGNSFPTITEILETAGGVRPSADLRQVEVRRPRHNGTTEVVTVDLWQLIQTGNLSNNIMLQDGDTVFVPTATTLSLAESTQIADASFASQENTAINIAIVGEVFRPGPYTVTDTARTSDAGVPGSAGSSGQLPTVTRAIQVAGGITPTANIRQVQIRRLTRTGVEQTFQVDLWKLLSEGDLEQDVILQDRDTIIVPTVTAIDTAEAARVAAASFSPNTIRVNIVGEVNRPGVLEVQPNAPLTQGLLTAGGFNRRASRSSVELVRLNIDGSVSRRQVPVDFAQGVNEASNPPLRNNDVIIVGRSGVAGLGDTLETITGPIGRFITLLGLLRLF